MTNRSFGYIPDFKGHSILKDMYLKIIGYPYVPRRNEARIVLNLLNPQEGEKILDIGCGDGVWYLDFKNRGYNIIGIDISKRDLLKLKDRSNIMKLRNDTLCCDAQNMCFRSSSFDKIFSICVFEHIPDDDQALKESNRILKPNGSLVISIPRNDIPRLIKLMISMPKIIKKFFGTSLIRQSDNDAEYRTNFDKKYTHYRNYDINLIEKKLINNGFEISQIEYNCKYFGAFVSGIIHSFKWFEWNKKSDTDYAFQSGIIYGFLFPIFHFLYRLDDIMYNNTGYVIVIHAQKKMIGK